MRNLKKAKILHDPTGGGTLPSHTLHLPQLYRTGAGFRGGCDMFPLPHLKTYLYLKIENTCLSMSENELHPLTETSCGFVDGVARGAQVHGVASFGIDNAS